MDCVLRSPDGQNWDFSIAKSWPARTFNSSGGAGMRNAVDAGVQVAEQATQYYTEALGEFLSALLSEIESRYVVLAELGRDVEGLAAAPMECDLATLPKAADRPSVAVLSFQASSEYAGDIGLALADLTREVIQQSRRYVLVDREQMRALLTEEELSQTLKCDDTRCLVNFGRKLRAQRIVHGRLSKVGNNPLLVIKMIDVSTSEVLAMRTMTGVGTTEELASWAQKTTKCLLLDIGS
jgi:TolB-like protein